MVIRRNFVWLILLGVIGCGPKAAPTPAPVEITGRLSATGGKPLGNVMLTLHPQDSASQGQRPTTLVRADGTFTVGCVPGIYKVTLTALPNAPGGGPGDGSLNTPGAAAAAGIPTAYTSAESSPWTIAVNETNGEFKHTLAK